MIGQERAAIAALKGGDMRGLEFMVQRHQLLALRIAYHITRSQDLAEDVAADRRITSPWPAPPFHLFLSRCMPAGLTDHMAHHILPFRVEGGRRDREIWVAAAGGALRAAHHHPA